MTKKSATAKKFIAIAAIAASSLACNAQQQVDQHTLHVLRSEYPEGIPGYLDWNDPDKNELMRRVAHLARQPRVMQQGEVMAAAEDSKVSVRWASLAGAVLLTGFFYSRNYKTWAERKMEADQRLGPAEPVKEKHFSVSNVLRKGTIECRALEETSNSLSRKLLMTVTVGLAKGFIPNTETINSTSHVVEHKSTSKGPRRMILVPEDGAWVWINAPDE